MRQEEQGIVAFRVRVVELLVVVKKRLGEKESGCVDQQYLRVNGDGYI
jgi:hypothetical protein